ncbi:cytochrome P450 [Actinomadura sp. 9N215]|uniref:cytochrome P450 n=1 Tax=Actinomadura sp. 9N215 TaxID=3375150 RepID=UPI00379AE411
MTDIFAPPVPALEFPVRTCPYQPPPAYDEHRARGPVTRVTMPSGDTGWLVTGYAEIRALFNDNRLSADRGSPDWPNFWPAPRKPRPTNAAVREAQEFNLMDDPEHAVLRRSVLPNLTVRRTRALRPAIRRGVDAVLDRMLEAGPPVDLIPAFAAPVPAVMMAELFGIDPADREFFEERVRRAATDRRLSGAALEELDAYLDHLIAVRADTAAAPRPGDLLSALAHRLTGGAGGLDRRQLVNAARVTLVAGNESTLNMIALGTLTLLAHPGEAAALREDPSRIPRAVEELLRYLSISDPIPRMAIEDIEIAGQVIRAGDGVLLSAAGANRDTAVFPDPNTLDLSRPARHHVAFGYGVHQCVGQNLARVVLESAYSCLLTRVPGLRLAVAPEEVGPSFGVGQPRITTLPVTW